jgi:predicted Zn finger-like uncharacterized protein
MSLATRCPACDTVFRVVQDQLRVSDGWVRCGRCSEVFNAAERLVDAEGGNPLRERAPDGQREHVIDDLARVSGQADAAYPGLPDAASLRGTTPQARPHAATTPPTARQSTEPEPEPAAVSEWADSSSGFGTSQVPADEPDLRAEPSEPPSFVRRADLAARWRRPRVRAALATLSLLAAGGLAAQVALEYRDLIAARWAVARPALELGCRWANCTIAPPRLIDALVVDSSGLVRVNGTSMYRLSVVLRNRAAFELAVPAIDLSLTDAQGQVIARRVLGLAELGVPQKSLASGSELPMKALLAAAGQPVTGYTIEIFYP